MTYMNRKVTGWLNAKRFSLDRISCIAEPRGVSADQFAWGFPVAGPLRAYVCRCAMYFCDDSSTLLVDAAVGNQ